MFDRLILVGNVVIDLVATVPALPERGGDVLARQFDATPGGGFNVMLAAARHGLPVAYAGAHGTGPFGDLARTALRDAGIAILHDARALDTGVVLVLVDDDGERTFVTSPAAATGATAAELDTVRPTVRDIVYVSGYELVGADPPPVAWLRGMAGLVVLDPGPLAPPSALVGVRERADWCTANAREAAAITGHADPVRAASVLMGRAGAIVRTGPDGCVVAVRGADPVVIAGFPVPIVDTTGAGDTHTGVFVAALAAGADPCTAARTANAAAALSVTRRGPATAPTPDELTAFLAARPRPRESTRFRR